jgi:hypothetical protein
VESLGMMSRTEFIKKFGAPAWFSCLSHSRGEVLTVRRAVIMTQFYPLSPIQVLPQDTYVSCEIQSQGPFHPEC